MESKAVLDIAKVVAKKLGKTQKECYEVIREAFPTILESMKEGNTLTIPAFGEFKMTKGSRGYDFSQEKYVKLPRRMVGNFKFSKTARDYFNTKTKK